VHAEVDRLFTVNIYQMTGAGIRKSERLLFRPSPDKGRTGGVCGSEIGFCVIYRRPTLFIPPLSGGKWGVRMGWRESWPTLCLLWNKMYFSVSSMFHFLGVEIEIDDLGTEHQDGENGDSGYVEQNGLHVFSFRVI
jgi:hypothetical protein